MIERAVPRRKDGDLLNALTPVIASRGYFDADDQTVGARRLRSESVESKSFLFTAGDSDLVVHVREAKAPDRNRAKSSVHTVRRKYDAFTLRGMLRDNHEQVVIDNLSVTVRQYTSPERCNEVMTALGKNPGEDSFLMRRGNHGKVDAQFYTRGVSRLEAVVADTDGSYVAHDRTLGDHPPIWIYTPTSIAHRLRDNAKALEGGRPDEVEKFATAVDNLSFINDSIITFTSEKVNQEWGMGETPLSRFEEVLKQRRLKTEHMGNRLFDGSIRPAYCEQNMIRILIDLGLMEGATKAGVVLFPKDAKGNIEEEYLHHIRARASDVYGKYMANVANIQGRVDEHMGPPVDDRVQIAKRREFIDRMQELAG